MKILIVGGAGYLGGALTDILSTTGNEILVYDDLLYEDAYFKNIPFVRGDVRDTKRLKPYLEWADSVVWLAAIVGDGACALNPGATKEVNQDSVKWLADNFNGQIIFMSTCSVYGAQEGLLTEQSSLNPLSLYASTKLKAESYLKGKNAIIFRLGTLFGVSDSYSRIRMDLVVNTLTTRAVTDGKLQVFGGNQYRPLLHVRDAALTIVQNLNVDVQGVFNLHRGNVKILDLANRIARYIPIEIEIIETTFEDTRNYRASSDTAKRLLNFDPVLRVEDGIQEIQKLVLAGRIKNVNNPRYSNVGFLEQAWK